MEAALPRVIARSQEMPQRGLGTGMGRPALHTIDTTIKLHGFTQQPEGSQSRLSGHPSNTAKPIMAKCLSTMGADDGFG